MTVSKSQSYSIKLMSVEDMLDALRITDDVNDIVECHNCGAARQQVGRQCPFCGVKVKP